uniref:hypothetical protein n=1 Tax=Photorhabdus sp. RM322S TaxID=3342825 RepID=UPI0036DAAFF9
MAAHRAVSPVNWCSRLLKMTDIGLAALVLLVAESAPTQKETMTRLIENMLVDVR